MLADNAHLNSSQANLDIAFFASNIRLVTDNGQKLPLLLSKTNWQNKQVTLIKLSNHLDANINTKITGNIAKHHRYTGIEFSIGVPQHLNHANPLVAQAPLNNSSMYWSWQQGYKFLRIDVSGQQIQWAFHLGSTGCQSPSPVRPPDLPCKKTNTVFVELSHNDSFRQVIYLNIQQIAKYAPHDQVLSCTGNYLEDNNCKDMLSTLGINPLLGRCNNNCSQQALFTTEPVN